MLSLHSPDGPAKYTDTVLRHLRMYQESNSVGLDSPDLNHEALSQSNLLVYQVTAKLPFTLDVVFESSSENGRRAGELSGDAYTKSLAEHISRFDEKFEETFKLAEKGLIDSLLIPQSRTVTSFQYLGYNESAVTFARAAMSNMIGGIGYFHGHSLVRASPSHPVTRYWNAPLYTAVPSRSFFPRGFLWDEGFHNLLISRWDAEISADILGHWMDLINDAGWIPREQILGLEARAKVSLRHNFRLFSIFKSCFCFAKVPAEFVVQDSSNANPPTLLLTLHSMVGDKEVSSQPWFADYLKRMWVRLETWYGWFQSTQAGEVPGTYR